MSMWKQLSLEDSQISSCFKGANSLICCYSVTKSSSTLCSPMDCSTPGFPVLHCLLEFAQTHVIESLMPSNHLILCCPLFLLPSVFPNIKVFSNESVLRIRGPSIGASASATVLPMEYSGLISFRMDSFDLLASKGLLRVFSSTSLKPSILRRLFMVELSHPYVTTGKTIGLTMLTFVGKVISLLNMLPRFVTDFFPRSKRPLKNCHGCSHCPQWFWSPRK